MPEPPRTNTGNTDFSLSFTLTAICRSDDAARAPTLFGMTTPPPRGARASRLADRAETPLGIAGLAFAEALFLPVPIEAALAPLMIRKPARRWRLVLWALLGSVLGIAALYGIGLALMDSVGDRVIALNGWQDEYGALRARFDEAGPATVAVIAVTPIPFTLAALAAGAARMNVVLFLAVAGSVRLARYAALAWLVGRYGERVRVWFARWRADPRARRVSWATLALGTVLLAWLWLR